MKKSSLHFGMRAAVTIGLAPGLLLWHQTVASAGDLAGRNSAQSTISEPELPVSRDLNPLAEIELAAASTGPKTVANAEPSADLTKDLADMDLEELVKVRVSPFEVSTQLDSGYRASNSVSASRFDRPIGELPFAIQAFTESFIQDQKPLIPFDVARYSPSVTYRSNDFNEGNANMAIRGFAVGTVPGSTQILRDGLPGPSILDFTNISRMEVVKGPSSFLYGQVAPGGIVNVITKNPESKFAATGGARYGSDNQYRFDFDVTGPATPTLFYRLAASYYQDMHYWKPYDGNTWDISPSLLWQPTDRLKLSLKYEAFQKDETPQLMQKPGYGTQKGVLPTPGDPNLSGVDVPGLPNSWNSMSYQDYRHSDSSNLSTSIDFKADEHWNLRGAYSHLEYKVDALASGNFGMANNTTFLQGRRFRGQTYTNLDDIYQLDATGQYNFDWASLRLLFGGQYVDRSFDNWAAQAPNDPALGSDPTASPLPLWDLRNPATWNRIVPIPKSALTENVTNQSTNYSDMSLYGSATVGLFDDRLLVLVGGRETWTESQLNNYVTNQVQPEINASAFTPQYGILYKLTPEWSLFGSYAKSFVPGTQLLNNPDGTKTHANPTEGEGYDIGVKYSLFGGRLSGTLTYFDIKNENIVNDLAVTDASGSVTIYNVQSGEQRSRGVELDATATLTDNWQLYGSYSYMDAKITEFSGHDDAILAQNPYTLDAAGQQNYKNVARFHDAPLQMSAPHLANLWTRYNFTQDWLKGFYVAGGVNLVVDQTLLPDSPGFAKQTYGVLNATVGYQWEVGGHRLSVDLMGKNLLDERYRPSQSTRSRPREVLLSFTASF